MPTTKLGWASKPAKLMAVYYGDSRGYPDAWALPDCIEHLTASEPDLHRDRNGNLTCVHCKDKNTPRYVPDEAFLSTLKWDIAVR